MKDNIAYICSSTTTTPTNENHCKTVIYNYFQGHKLGFGIITSDMEIWGWGIT